MQRRSTVGGAFQPRLGDRRKDAALNQHAAASAQPGTGDVLSPEQVGKILNVAETDVVASLESGDLKGKKIGSQWRVTRAAVEQFLR